MEKINIHEYVLAKNKFNQVNEQISISSINFSASNSPRKYLAIIYLAQIDMVGKIP